MRAKTSFLTGRADWFANEVELFLASELNIEAYDEVYMLHMGWKPPGMNTDDEVGEFDGHVPLVPYLYIFDEDSDGIE
ncbi:hypothetical protein U1Q18_003644 [Sarracenia purpurea var. burkii]